MSWKKYMVSQIREKGVDNPCPRCNSFDFEVVGHSVLPLNEKEGLRTTFTMGCNIIPCIVIACSNCGFVTLHATSVLER